MDMTLQTTGNVEGKRAATVNKEGRPHPAEFPR